MKAASCRSAKAAYLMREAIHRHQSPSMDGLGGSVLGDGHEVIGKEPLE